MWQIILAAGWPIWPLIFASVVALAIIGERALALREATVAPKDLLPEVQNWLASGGVTKETISKLEPVSYTHLDVYKRQLITQAPQGKTARPTHAQQKNSDVE